MGRVLVNDSGDRGSIPDRVIPKTQKMVLVAIEKGAFGSPSTTVANFTFTFYIYVSVYIYMYIYKCICVCV